MIKEAVKQAALKAFKGKLSEEWIEKLQDCLPTMFLKIAALKKAFPEKNEKGYYHKDGILLFPKLSDILNPFRFCPVDKLKVVIVNEQPYNNGEATGLPFEVLPFQYKPITTLPLNQQNVDTLDDCILSNNRDFEVFHGVNWKNLVSQGVLSFNICWTSEYLKTNAHFKVWKSFSEQLLTTLYAQDETLVFVGIGRFASNFLQTCIPNADLITTPNAYPVPYEIKKAFISSKPFVRTNLLLEARNKQLLVFN